MPPPKSTYLNLQFAFFKILSITFINFLNGSIFCIWLPICTLKHSIEMFLKFFDLLHKSKKAKSQNPSMDLLRPRSLVRPTAALRAALAAFRASSRLKEDWQRNHPGLPIWDENPWILMIFEDFQKILISSKNTSTSFDGMCGTVLSVHAYQSSPGTVKLGRR